MLKWERWKYSNKCEVYLFQQYNLMLTDDYYKEHIL